MTTKHFSSLILMETRKKMSTLSLSKLENGIEAPFPGAVSNEEIKFWLLAN